MESKVTCLFFSKLGEQKGKQWCTSLGRCCLFTPAGKVISNKCQTNRPMHPVSLPLYMTNSTATKIRCRFTAEHTYTQATHDTCSSAGWMVLFFLTDSSQSIPNLLIANTFYSPRLGVHIWSLTQLFTNNFLGKPYAARLSTPGSRPRRIYQPSSGIFALELYYCFSSIIREHTRVRLALCLYAGARDASYAYTLITIFLFLYVSKASHILLWAH